MQRLRSQPPENDVAMPNGQNASPGSSHSPAIHAQISVHHHAPQRKLLACTVSSILVRSELEASTVSQFPEVTVL
ncbi:hypothetical protein SKAU_G00045940 [Synaphobranchus kaupii]|uniref:Uncharacterized protein n=1 Tax=Synaphobranchus kaupii TaxID=118154 RepID=A0A9Q1G231_SYNKA|nr:hypothetical protein SKAU_G00045940 [Synaphobranchus kaupii]